MSTDNRFKSTPGKQVVSSAIAPQKQNITPPLEKQILASTFTTKWRLSIWKQAIDFARESMWLGKGFGVYPDYYFPTDPNHLMQNIKKIDVGSGIIPAHNELITIFYKMGLIGLGIFLFFNIYVFIMGHRALQITKQSFSAIVNLTTLGCFCWWHIMALTSDMIDSPNMNIFLWVFLGILLNLMNTKNKEGSFG